MMNPSRLVSALLAPLFSSHRRPQARGCGAQGLRLERLEERWAPAVDWEVIGNTAYITGDSASDSIQIIDDLADVPVSGGGNYGATYLQIGKQAPVLLGTWTTTGYFHLDIRMNGGNDTVTFTVKGTADTDNWYDSLLSSHRYIDLGEGNDTLNILIPTTLQEGRANLDEGSLAYSVAGREGNDTYNFKGSLFNTDAEEAFQVVIEDSAGNDRYTFAPGTLTRTNIEFKVYDWGPGKNTFTWTQGDFTESTVGLDLRFTGGGANTFKFGGDAWIDDTVQRIYIAGGAGVDSVTVNDNVVYNDSLYEIDFYGYGGNDSFTVTADGLAGSALPAFYDAEQGHFAAYLGEGTNKYTATVGSSYHTATEDGVAFYAEGGSGVDTFTFTSKGEIQAFDGPFGVIFKGHGGNDVFNVNLGRVYGYLPPSSTKPFNALVQIEAGTGADKVTLSGVLYNAINSTLQIAIDLGGNDNAVDTLTSNLKSDPKSTKFWNIHHDSHISGVKQSGPYADRLSSPGRLKFWNDGTDSLFDVIPPDYV